jgi:hypothetical protein
MVNAASPVTDPVPGDPALAGLLHRQDLRRLGITLAVIIASAALRLLTYNVVADGGHPRYVKTVLIGAGAAAVVWWLVRVQTGRRSWLPLAAAVAVLLSGDAVHYVRLANPITRGGPVLAFSTTFADETAVRRQWDVETTGGGTVTFSRGAMLLQSPPRATAYAIARIGTVPDVRISWWLPVGLAERERTERLAWRATVDRTGEYYVVTEIRHLLIQAVGYGIHVTYPDEKDAPRGYEIPHPAGNDRQPHDWLLVRDTRQLSLSIDGKVVWSAPQREELGQVKLGETHVDPLHGGSMRVESVSYVAALDRS